MYHLKFLFKNFRVNIPWSIDLENLQIIKYIHFEIINYVNPSKIKETGYNLQIQFSIVTRYYTLYRTNDDLVL